MIQINNGYADYYYLKEDGTIYNAATGKLLKHDRELEEREAAKRREKAKKEIERQLLEAIVSTMEQGSEMVADAAATDIVASINAALNGTPAPASKKSFSVELGAMLGRALGQAPFKLLEEIFKDDEERRKR